MIKYHPEQDTIVICDFSGFVLPEMQKRRPSIVVSPKFKERTGLCTIVPCSTTAPFVAQPYHYLLKTSLPAPFVESECWVKCDMIYSVSFSRLFVPHDGKDVFGKRVCDCRVINDIYLRNIQRCILAGLGIK